MNNHNSVKYVYLLSLSLLLFSSVHVDASISQPESSKEFITISETSDGVDIYAVMPITSKALNAETMDALISISDDGKTYYFRNDASQLNQINAGDVILSKGSPLAPYGFMRRVAAISTEPDQTIFQTEQAVLTDVFHEASVSISQQITPVIINETILSEGVSLMETDGEVFTFTFDKILFDEDGETDTINDQIKVDGQATIDLSYDFDFEITAFPPSLDQLAFLVDVTESVDINVESGNVTFVDDQFEVEIAKKKLNPIVIGGVPFVPELTLSVGLDGTVQANISASVSQQFDYDGGVLFDGDDWEVVLTEFNNSFSYELPDLSDSNFEFKAFTNANVDFLIAGLPLGPSLSLKPYLLLSVDHTANPWWELTGGLDIDLGMFLKPFGVALVDLEFALINYNRVLAGSWSNTIYLPMVNR
ncbi:MAG: hypothetical protein GY943_38185 [Chloroflexi bacterium]|nr:hypothetical protein [Chloroflexota bacterium]